MAEQCSSDACACHWQPRTGVYDELETQNLDVPGVRVHCIIPLQPGHIQENLVRPSGSLRRERNCLAVAAYKAQGSPRGILRLRKGHFGGQRLLVLPCIAKGLQQGSNGVGMVAVSCLYWWGSAASDRVGVRARRYCSRCVTVTP
jgi:hypothetical protein